ncbi:MAG: T9SS type A sorting domain-containing protein [Bacteroidales bacterium]|jgi:hypothetical protein|nr:T9SS type A sorting domain-containing protein [Bacteroidales bacterium]
MYNNYFFLLTLLLFIKQFSAISQNCNVKEDVVALTTIESNSYTINFEYNKVGLVISETKKSLEDDYSNYKYEYEYDNMGNMTHLTKYGIYLTHQEEMEYNEFNQIVVKKIYEDYGSGLKYIEQNIYYYLEHTLTTILKQAVYNEQVNNSTKQEFFYNKDKQLIQVMKSDWVAADWIHTETFNYEYNDIGDILYYTNEGLQWENFENYWRYFFHYNDDSELIERSYHTALGSEWSPRPLQRYLYYYDSHKENETLLFPNIYQFDELGIYWFKSGKKLTQHDFWLADCGGSPYFVESAKYSYKPITINVGVESYPNDGIMLYPNPTTGELRVVSSEYRVVSSEIFDVYGRAVTTHYSLLTTHYSLDISQLPAGVYFIKITTEIGTQTKKVIIY